MMNELSRWYESLTYEEAKNILREKMDVMKKNFIAAGYYMKYIRDNELFREDGYESIWEFAEDNYGIRKSTASRWMAMNDKFSQGGNSPNLADEFKGFEKSQLQEMLYLDDKQLEEVTPDMTVKEIREVRKPEPLSAYGTKRRVYREGSLIKTAGCEGRHDCFMCSQDCLIRGEDRYCKDAPMGNPFPCEMIDIIPALRNNLGERCLFVNQDLADHYPTGDARPCCEDCKDPCPMECDRALFARGEMKEDDSADDKENAVATSQQNDSDPDGLVDMNPPEDVDDHADLREDPAEVEKVEAEVVEQDELPADGKFEELSDKTDMDLLRDLLDREKDRLDLMREEYSENDIRVRKQKLIVGAYAGMIADLDICSDQNHEQPELPTFRNNDQRKEWLRNYKAWGLWYEDKNIGARYYKYNFQNGARLIVEEYVREWELCGELTSSYLHLVGGPEPPKKDCISKWQRHEVYARYQNSETELVEFLKYVQKGAKENADRKVDK